MELADGTVTRARIAFGGMAGTPKRATAAEVALLGQSWDLATVTVAMEALKADYAPLTDWRASADYRRTVAANLLLKFFHEHGGQTGTRLVGRLKVAHA